MKITRKAHSKLNLFLEVTGKRQNGYHELHSLVVFLDLADEITVEPFDKIRVYETGGKSGIKNNIIATTARKLAGKYDVKQGAKITFTKNIPIGGGLGGGSADAAATLVLLNNLWNLRLKAEELYAIGLEIGADVPVCLYSIIENKNTAIFKGIGEIIEPAPKLPDMSFVLINPGKELATGTVFKAFRPEEKPSPAFYAKGDFFKNLSARRNDLENTSKKLMPEIAEAIAAMAKQKNCKLARMTGSGATSFGLFKNEGEAKAAAVAILKKHPDWRIGPANLKKTSDYTKAEKIKRPFLKKQVWLSIKIRDFFEASKTLKKIAAWLDKYNIKTLLARSFVLSIILHTIGFFIYDLAFKPDEIEATPQMITITFGVDPDKAAQEQQQQVADNSANDTGTAQQSAEEEEPAPVPQIAQSPEETSEKQSTELNKTILDAKHKKAEKQVEKKSSKAAPQASPKPETKTNGGSNYGNTTAPAEIAAADYLELLQYTVQELNHVPPGIPGLRGVATLRLQFNRKGYVTRYVLYKPTGEKILDDAATNVAKRLMKEPFPPAPKDFDAGDRLLTYDFQIKYPPDRK